MNEKESMPSVLLSGAILDAIVGRLVEAFHPERVILFGSRARGTAHRDSDVDLLVVMPFTGSRLRVAVEIRKVLRGLGIAKDIMVMTPEEFAVRKEIPGTLAYPASREGKVLHAA
jgi:predicted nucleotidyltransferase